MSMWGSVLKEFSQKNRKLDVPTYISEHHPDVHVFVSHKNMEISPQ